MAGQATACSSTRYRRRVTFPPEFRNDVRSWECFDRAMPYERDVAAHLHRFNAIRGPHGQHAQFAWAAGELTLVQGESFTATDQAMAEAIGANRASSATRGHILDDSVV